MAHNQTGIAFVIRGFLPIGKTLDEQLEALTLVKTSHETKDYAALLEASQIEDVKTEQKTRRVEGAGPLSSDGQPQTLGGMASSQNGEGKTGADGSDGKSSLMEAFDPAGELNEPEAEAEPPAFIRKSKKETAA